MQPKTSLSVAKGAELDDAYNSAPLHHARDTVDFLARETLQTRTCALEQSGFGNGLQKFGSHAGEHVSYASAKSGRFELLSLHHRPRG